MIGRIAWLGAAVAAFAFDLAAQDLPSGTVEIAPRIAPAAQACPDANQVLPLACPALWQSLEQASLSETLGLDSQTPADAKTVTQLQEVLRVQQAAGTAPKPFSQAQLDRSLEANYRLAKKEEKGFFARLAEWWDALFESDEKPIVQGENWLKKMWPTETAARFVFYFMAVLFIAIACLMGWREIRPFLDESRLKQAKKRAQQQRIAALWPPPIAGLTPASAMAEIYQRLVLIYTQKDQLPNVPGLTHAELAQAYHNEALEAEFATLSDQAAASLFARVIVSAEHAQDYLKRADALVRSLGPSAQGGAVA